MKKALILSVFAALTLSFAASAQAPMFTAMQGARPRTRQESSPESIAEKEADMLKAELKLSKGQYNKIFNFLYEQAADMMESGMGRSSSGGPGMGGHGFGGDQRGPGAGRELTQEQKEQMQQRMQEMQVKREKMQAAKVKKFSRILKPAQFEKWQQMEKERVDRMEEMRERFRENGQPHQQPDAE